MLLFSVADAWISSYILFELPTRIFSIQVDDTCRTLIALKHDTLIPALTLTFKQKLLHWTSLLFSSTSYWLWTGPSCTVEIFNCEHDKKEDTSSAKCHCFSKGFLYVRQETRLRAGRLGEVDWIYKVCLRQHSYAPPSAFYPVNQFCCFVLLKERRLWKRMLSACRSSLLVHTVCRSRLMLLPGSTCSVIMSEADSARMRNFFKFIMSLSSLTRLRVKPDSLQELRFGFACLGRKSQIWLVLCC